MPQLVDHIDKIARKKKRDVLFIIFDRDIFSDYKFENWTIRNDLIEWFKINNIEVIPCGNIANESGFESYRGQLYIDVPYDKNHPDYVKVSHYLENSDGSFRISGVLFCYLTLDLAMKNKHHDVPGFWEQWAKNF